MRPFDLLMRKQTKILAQGAVLAALYAVLTHLQNAILPGSANWAIQLRMSEVLCVLSFFTPAAAPGLSLGCLLYNLTAGAGLPLDFLVGSLASLLACLTMEKLRKLPWLGALCPALFNGLLVGWELWVYMGGGFWMNALYVAIGEAIVLLALGMPLYYVIRARRLQGHLFCL